MPFPQVVKEEALTRSKRACCICNEFVGRPTEVHHIVQEANGGPNTLENAIVLCLRCHSEVGHYNPKHPIGNKYSVNELKEHRDNWWAWCKENPNTPPPKNPIVISPSTVTLAPKAWKTRLAVTVYSKSDDIWYQIVIKMTIGLGIIKAEDIDLICSAPRDEHKIDEGGGFALDSQLFRIDGINSAGQQVTYLWLHSLDPRQAIKLILTNRSKKHIIDPHPPKIFFEIQDFSQEQAHILVQEDGAVAIPFQAPETLTNISAALRLQKTQRTNY